MSSSLRNMLVSVLAEYMKDIPKQRANELAHELTCTVSSYLSSGEPSFIYKELDKIFPENTWSILTLGVPWEAFYLAYEIDEIHLTEEVKPLCCAPANFDNFLADQSTYSGIWGGTLLVAIGEILRTAKKELIIFAPYWRVDGIKSLMAAASRESYKDLEIRIFTQSKSRMKYEDKEGLEYLVDSLIKNGAKVKVFAPKPLEIFTPMLHAKLIISDRKKAYVGSANFTMSGLNYGIEAGVLITGESSQALAAWSTGIEKGCEFW